MATIKTLGNGEIVTDVEVSEISTERLVKLYWSTKDSLPICRGALKSAMTDRSKKVAERNLETTKNELNVITQELLQGRGIKSVKEMERGYNITG